MPGTAAYGRALEHLIANELRAYLSYRDSRQDLTYYRSRSQIEVDFVVGDQVAIEVKGSGRVSERDAKPLHALGEDAPIRTKIIVCRERSERRIDSGVRVFPLRRFLEELWGTRLCLGPDGRWEVGRAARASGRSERRMEVIAEEHRIARFFTARRRAFVGRMRLSS